MTKPFYVPSADVPSSANEDPSGWPSREIDQAGAFDVGLNLVEKRALKSLMKASGADRNFHETLGAIAGDDFSPAELQSLEARVLDHADPGDVGALFGIETGVPVMLSGRQKIVVDGLLGKLGGDPVAVRSRTAFGKAIQAGRIKVR